MRLNFLNAFPHGCGEGEYPLNIFVGLLNAENYLQLFFIIMAYIFCCQTGFNSSFASLV